MNIRETNRRVLIEYFEAGSKKNCIEKLGVELEQFIVNADTLEAVPYYGERGIEAILRELASGYPYRVETHSHLIGLYNNDYSITLEPAGQIEVSIVPKESISLIYKIYRNFLRRVEPVLEKYHYKMVTLGYQPLSCVKDLPLIPKKRYEYMNRYFAGSGTCGMNMMRGTAATQVSIDYCSEADFVTKFRLAYQLMPLLELLTDNSPVFEGQPYQKHMLRSYIWEHVDERRTGIVPGTFEEDFGFASYADYLLDLPLIFIPNKGSELYTAEQTTAELWEEEVLTQEDIEHVLSMSFTDVRLKNYIEIRFADSMPIEYVLGYLALIKGIFYSTEGSQKIAQKLNGGVRAIEDAEKNLVRYGFNGEAYGYMADELLLYLVDEAKQHLEDAERKLLHPLEELIKSRRTLAGAYYENNK